jgi:hypothetical protein
MDECCFNCLIKDRPIIMLTSFVRLWLLLYMLTCSVYCRMMFQLLTLGSLIAIVSFDLAFLAVYTELSGNPGKFQIVSNVSPPCQFSGQIDWHASGFRHPVSRV